MHGSYLAFGSAYLSLYNLVNERPVSEAHLRGFPMQEAHLLHLRDLHIQGFRGIDKLHFPRLGRVTLLVGRNGIGKTTVLDAVRIYAAHGDHPALRDLLLSREEYAYDEGGGEERISIPDADALFYGRNYSRNGDLSIGSSDRRDQLRIEIATQDELLAFLQHTQRLPSTEMWIAEGRRGVKVTFQDRSIVCPLGFPFRVPTRSRLTASRIGIRCESMGPSTLSNRDLVWFWDSVALTNDDQVAIDSLNVMLNSEAEGDAVIGVHAPEAGRGERQLMVRLKSHHRPIPLRSLGDGALRMFSVALALTNSRDGFLLIDEAENGLHYSVQSEFWRMVLRTAQARNVQVLATTHSWDCVSGFARAALESPKTEGVLYRLSRRHGYLQAIEYPEDELKIAADQHIEVR